MTWWGLLTSIKTDRGKTKICAHPSSIIDCCLDGLSATETGNLPVVGVEEPYVGKETIFPFLLCVISDRDEATLSPACRVCRSEIAFNNFATLPRNDTDNLALRAGWSFPHGAARSGTSSHRRGKLFV
jgi:hypothetical protein